MNQALSSQDFLEPEYRRDPITGRWVIIAPERSRRPIQAMVTEADLVDFTCPFCAGREMETPQEVLAHRDPATAADQPGWHVRVVPNRYPAVRPLPSVDGYLHPGAQLRLPGTGAHEVVIECPHHERSLAQLPVEHIAKVMHTYRERMCFYSNDSRWEYIQVFKNEGAQAGASLEHAHSQIVALPLIPPVVLDELEGARNYRQQYGNCVFCAMIQEELTSGARLVARTAQLAAICPLASRFPYETWILPIEHAAYFQHSSDDLLMELAILLRQVLKALNQVAHDPPFNYLIHSAPLRLEEPDLYHWHIEILPRLTEQAGFEWASGMGINPTAPEQAAFALREAAIAALVE